MKQLSKEQLYDLVKDAALTVGERNIDNMLQNLTKAIEGKEDSGATTLSFISAYGTEITKLWCQILVDTLYSVLYEEERGENNSLKGEVQWNIKK